MQNYIQTGVDQNGFLVYHPSQQSNNKFRLKESEPTQQHKIVPSLLLPQQNKKNYGSWFSKFFIIDDGVISLSLKDLTLILSFGISITLILMCVVACSEKEFVCTSKDFPMVSDVIALPMYDRTFIILTAIMMFGVQQVNIRAFYKKLYGIVSDQYNDFLIILGGLSCIALPLIGVFDEHQWGPVHGTCAFIFFGGFGFYCILLGRALYQNKDKFPASQQRSIKLMMNNTWGLLIFLVAFLISIALVKSSVPTPFIEWATVLYFVNFFAIASFTNDFYDSVHEDGKLIPKQD
ncbi:UNKNOWN [Stylonychia lemnae]|uniref:CWH43-like N-terminal domain-containing protein n=1 Tax=Stylonychia lemnae TaxID=5949 RepID=A0A078ABV3_STYLE|nr:UNKNOWN [Stylonychia lemnae]|eukprot:CDW78258.1 UNKNOWN [Stylonychia lemnae]